MYEHLKKREQVRDVARDLMRTFGALQPKLEHFATTLPDKSSVIQILNDLLEVTYPGYFGRKYVESLNLEYQIEDLLASIQGRLTQQIYRSVRPACANAPTDTMDLCDHCQAFAEGQVLLFLRKLVDLRQRLSQDVQAAYDGDPAAKSIDEVIFAYPGIFAITIYRLAHELHKQGIPLLPRIMTEYAHSITGIDIHPGATIGSTFFIDHGTGVVIGETTNIGDRVKLYQGVTLGALSFGRGEKRHPTIEDDVVIYAGATILGGTTVIGNGSVIGGNVWLTRSIPPRTRVMIADPQLVIDSTEK